MESGAERFHIQLRCKLQWDSPHKWHGYKYSLLLVLHAATRFGVYRVLMFTNSFTALIIAVNKIFIHCQWMVF